MKKNALVILTIVCLMCGIGCIVGVLYSFQNIADEKMDKITRLEEDLRESNQRADDYKTKINKLSTQLKKSDKKYDKIVEELESLKAVKSSESDSIPEETVSTPEPTLEPTATPESQETILSNGICDFDYTGTYQGEGQTITISYADPGDSGLDASQTYIIKIKDDYPGAHGMLMVDLAGSIFTDGCSLVCNGVVTHILNDTYKDAGSQSAYVTHEGDQIFYTMDGYERGPYNRVG